MRPVQITQKNSSVRTQKKRFLKSPSGIIRLSHNKTKIQLMVINLEDEKVSTTEEKRQEL